LFPQKPNEQVLNVVSAFFYWPGGSHYTYTHPRIQAHAHKCKQCTIPLLL